MRRKKLICGVCASVITLAIAGLSNSADATDFTELPAAGAAVVLGEGTAYDEVQDSIEAYVASLKQTTESEEVETKVAGGTEEEVLPTETEIEEVIAEESNAEPVVMEIAEVKDIKVIPASQLEIPGADFCVKEPEKNEFENLVIAQVNDYVNVRESADTESEIVGKLYDDSVGTLLEEKDGWYQIQSGSVTGYVKAEYCVVGEDAEALVEEVGTRVATVNTTTLKVRKEAGTDATVLGLVPIEEELVVLEETDGWVKVSIEEGEGFVSNEFVDLRTDFVQAESKEEEAARLEKEAEARRLAREAAAQNTNKFVKSTDVPVISGGSEMGVAVAQYACQFVGNPYVYGGSSLTNGTDCSGFVMSVYANFGVSLPHSSTADRSQGYAVDGLANAQPGDLICYSGHVALYIGNNQIVHASSSKTGIIISNADYKTILAVRRIF